MGLEIVTFTGIDLRTSMSEAHEIQMEFPRVEFGILVGSKTHPNTSESNRFPPLSIIDSWRIKNTSETENTFETEGIAIHLCGKYSRDATRRDGDMEHAFDICTGFERVQVNSAKYPDHERIERFAEEVDARSIILQRRSAEHPIHHPQIEYLFDKSGGRGTEGFSHWPDPEREGRCGYAGGINPGNVAKVLEFVTRHGDRRVWIDMETGVRTDDWLDLGKVREVCEAIFGGGS